MHKIKCPRWSVKWRPFSFTYTKNKIEIKGLTYTFVRSFCLE
ncbi:hypothetical protein D018_0587 [Vibrio parahaemolyticus VP2007-007]|nr:hypothetical protein D018_0587 [Vibrio parahaemolyticus VP2007-007]